MKLNIYNTPEELLVRLADFFVKVANESIAQRSRFTVALSGGSSPKKLYELLSSNNFQSRVDWTKVFFFFGDERHVPQSSPDSNFLMVKNALFDPLQISEQQIFAVDTALQPKASAEKYANLLRDFFKGEICFDLVLLGLGDNAHTASLFPHTTVLQTLETTVKEVWLQDKSMFRITFTAPLINAANQIVFLVYGHEKAEAVHHVIEGKKDIENFPAQLIKPNPGSLEWFLDCAAASNLSDRDI